MKVPNPITGREIIGLPREKKTADPSAADTEDDRKVALCEISDPTDGPPKKGPSMARHENVQPDDAESWLKHQKQVDILEKARRLKKKRSRAAVAVAASAEVRPLPVRSLYRDRQKQPLEGPLWPPNFGGTSD